MSDLADALIAAHGTAGRVDSMPGPLSRDDILEVQRRVLAHLGPVAGFKVGRCADGPPILAPIPACYCVANGGTRPVRDRLGVELEIGFELIRPLPGNRLPGDPAAFFRPCVAFELVDTRLTGRAATDPALKFADLQINAGLVVGRPLADWTGTDFGPVEARFTAGDAVVLEGAATVPGGSALANLDLLIRHLCDHCGGLRPGQIVITGSLCGLPYFGPGVTLRAEIAGLGAVCLTLVAAPDPASGTAAPQDRAAP